MTEAALTVPISLTVNGVERSLTVDPGRRLARVLRDDLGLTGTKVGCDAGDCGACTVLLDGAQVCACLVPVAQAEGAAVVTVEGLAGPDGRLSALQRAFHRHGAAQCGICTPGMLMAAADLLAREARPSRAQALDALGGVLCRCTGYQKIVEAVLDVASDAPPTRRCRKSGARSGRGSVGSTASPGSTAASATPTTNSPTAPSGCGCCARRTRSQISRSATSPAGARRRLGWWRC